MGRIWAIIAMECVSLSFKTLLCASLVNLFRERGNMLPCRLDVALLSVRLPDVETDREFPIELGMGEVEFPGAVERIQKTLIDFIAVAVAEADEVQRRRRSELEAIVGTDPRFEELRQAHVLADVELQSFYAVMADYEPELQGAKSPAERNLPIAIVDHRPGLAGLILQIFRQHAQRVDQSGAVRHIEAIAIEVGEHPLVRVEAIAVGEFEAVMDEAELRAHRGRAAHRRIHVQPDAVLAAELADREDRIDRVG